MSQENSTVKTKKRLAYALIALGITMATAACLLYLNGRAAAPRPAGGERVPSSRPISKEEVDSYTVAPDLPKYVGIPALKIEKARVMRLGINSRNQIAEPRNIYDAGWYEGSAKPGRAGAMFIYGHVSSWEANGLFHDLSKLKPGDKIIVTAGDDKTYTYEVESSKTYPYDKVDMKTVLSPIKPDRPGLNLMTCGGKLIKGTNNFSERLVVFAGLTS